MVYEHIAVEIDAGIARVVLSRPERRNALSLALLRELGAAIRDLGTNGVVRVIVISGAGPVFSAGHDLGEMIDRPQRFYDDLFAKCTDVMLSIQTVPQPVIAQVHGMATAAGCQLVAACDLAIATDDCRFATPGVKIGLFCSTPMVPIVRSVGRKRALQMLFTGEPIDAATAVQWGLVNRAVPGKELAEAVADLTTQITRSSPAVLAIGKHAFYQQIGSADEAAYAVAGPIMAKNAIHGDAQEGMQAFLDKRDPIWPSQS
jgi:enoyl-CoA hydratase/carnithine racemase